MRNIINTWNGSTTKWRGNLNFYYLKHVKNNASYIKYLADNNISDYEVNVHLAVFSQPFLSLLLDGTKTIESRFSINRVNPFNRVKKGDVVFFKKSGGLVYGYFVVGNTEYYESPSPAKLKDLAKRYSAKICSMAVDNFWEDRSHCRFISLFEVAKVTPITPFKIDKKDRMAWATINNESTSLHLWQN